MEKEETLKKTKMKKMKKNRREKKKRPNGVTTRDGPKKLIFHIRGLKGNREAIDAKKNEHPRKRKNKTEKKEHERK